MNDDPFYAFSTGYAPGAQVGYASPLSYSAPLSYSNVYNAPLSYSRFNGGLGAGIAGPSPLAVSPLAGNPLAYSSPLALNGLAGYGGLGLAGSPLAYSNPYNNPYLRSGLGNGLIRPFNYLY